MPQISIIIEYDIHEGRENDFIALMKDHARRTLFEEEGCLRFEVLKPEDEHGLPIPGQVMVSELYADRTAVGVHKASPHLSALRATIGSLIRSRRLIVSQVLNGADEEGMTPDQLSAANDD